MLPLWPYGALYESNEFTSRNIQSRRYFEEGRQAGLLNAAFEHGDKGMINLAPSASSSCDMP